MAAAKKNALSAVLGKKGIHKLKIRDSERLFFLLEIVFPSSTHGANPVIRDVIELRAGGYAVIRISLSRIIHIPANRAHIPVHVIPPFLVLVWLRKPSEAKVRIRD